jgi:hypothetical protein
VLILPVLALAACPDRVLAEGKKFLRLTGKDIRLKVIGKVVTDGAHWSDYFEKDGSLVSWSMGRRSSGIWEIHGDALCIMEEAGANPTCYEAWIAGDEISLRLNGIETTFTGYLRKYEGP